MSPVSTRRRSLLLATAAACLSVPAAAQTSPQSQLPPVTVDAPQQKRTAAARPSQPAATRATRVQRAAPAPTPRVSTSEWPGTGLETPAGGSLTVPGIAQARAIIDRIPGGVALVPDTAFKNGPANTIRDVLGWVPGVITQPKSNIDNRVSIRGSGLTRNFGNRGINVYMDGIPINTADGLFDLFEIDPTAYRYVEVYKGANGLRYGANSLGGAINFVTPTGRDASPFEARFDAGSFGFVRGQASTGGVKGPADWFVTGSAQREDGFREHSNGNIERLNANVGYQFSPDAETRFYLNANSWRQRLPGELTKTAALTTPRAADPEFVRQDQQRNINSIRLANKTTLRFGPTTVDFGIFTHQRHVDHPIFRYLDYYVNDYGGFIRAKTTG